VLAPNGKEKLSKRNALKLGYTVFAVAYKGIDSDGEDVNLPGFREMGYEPGALLNFLALLGWHPSGDREIMSTDELVSAFELERCSPSGARFDFDKLNHFNFEYVRALPDTELVPPGYFARFDAADYLKVAEWTRERAHFRRDAPATWRPFFFAPDSYLDMDKTRTPDAKAVWREFCTRAMRLREDRGHALPWTRDAIEAELSAVCESLGVKKGKVMPFLRTALTGGAPGPDLLDTLRMLGRHDGTDRILDAISLTTKS
jgi:glutamyl-tRNA synthetase